MIENERKQKVAGVVIIGLVVLLGVRVVDPSLLLDTSPSVDISESPGDIVQDAIADLQSTDYTVEVTSDGNPVYVRRVENTDRQSFTVIQSAPPSERRRFFRTDGMEWTRRGTDSWKKYPPGLFRSDHANPLGVPEQSPDATVINETDRILVIRIDDRDVVRTIARGDPCLGPIEFEIDKRSRRLQEVRRQRECPDRQLRQVYRFTNYGETEVTRPDDVPQFSVEELFWDVFRTEFWPATIISPTIGS